jgi:eukaryotic-like serine/threonine-protein kinase
MSAAFGRLSRFIGRFTGKNRCQTSDSGASEGVHLDHAAPDITSEESASGTVQIPNYTLLSRIGHGAYGEVWLARGEIGTYHAVKIVYKHTFGDRSPFEREYRGILQYTPISRTHHGLVPILHVGRNNSDGYFYYVMELADCVRHGRQVVPEEYLARTLAHELDARGRLPARECLQLGIELCEALRHLHSRQLIHRDIKPANIIYVNGMAKLADVGLVTHVAEARRDPKHLGTEGFTPPEGPGTPIADVYSLGKVLCEASLGPAGLQGVPVSLEEIEEPERGHLAQVVEIFFRACHEDHALRIQNVEMLDTELMGLQDQWERQA